MTKEEGAVSSKFTNYSVERLFFEKKTFPSIKVIAMLNSKDEPFKGLLLKGTGKRPSHLYIYGLLWLRLDIAFYNQSAEREEKTSTARCTFFCHHLFVASSINS